MKRPDPPCGKHCEKRHAGCHSECEPYQQFAKDNEQYRQERLKESRVYQDLHQTKNNCVLKCTHYTFKQRSI